jgi:hypothetical protein
MTSLESTPQIIELSPQPYVAVREAVAMSTLNRVADHIPELLGWLAQRGETPSGAPFFRYLAIDMERDLEVEAGVPVATPLDLAAEAGGAVTAENSSRRTFRPRVFRRPSRRPREGHGGAFAVGGNPRLAVGRV